MLTSTRRRVEREVVPMEDTECAVHGCVHDGDVLFGVRVRRVEETDYLKLASREDVVGTNTYCPFHTEDTEYSTKAFQRQQEAENHRNYKRIINSDVLPRFVVNGSTLDGPDTSRCRADLSGYTVDEVFEEAIGLLSNVTTDHPLLLVSKGDGRAVVLEPETRSIADEYTKTDAPAFEDFKDEYGDVEWYERDYYFIRTAPPTGARDLIRGVDSVVERGAYRNLKHVAWRVNFCPVCSGRRVAIRGVHRVIVNGTEELVPFHTWNSCKRHLGVVNRDLVDEEKLDYR